VWIAVPLYLAGTLWRIHDEEVLMGEAFGEAYRQYQSRSWRLIPFVY
jgi:protein-S-isoprenylcysteine O-methyltransferase Ste14